MTLRAPPQGNGVPRARTITAGTGLTGGGSLAADRTVSLATATLATLGIKGLRLRYSSATAVIVETGYCANSALDALLTLDTETTVSITTINAISGLDEKTCTATATTHGTATFEPSASLYVETPLSSTVRSLTGTISTSTAAVTGTSTKFLTELGIGDVIRSATKGASRVTAIASDTACTLVAALPGGDCTGEAATCYENLIVRIASETPQRVNTVSHNGLSVVVPSAWTSNTSGVAIKLGGEIVSAWYFAWLVSGGSGTGCILSTQRTTPYGVTGYTTSRRRICATYNSSGGDIAIFAQTLLGTARFTHWDTAIRVVSAGTATSFTDASYDAGAAPATATLGLIQIISVTGASATGVNVRGNGQAGGGQASMNSIANQTVDTYGFVSLIGGALEYRLAGAGSNTEAYVDVAAFVEPAS